MRIVEDYVQRKVDEKTKIGVLNLRKKGFSLVEIAETLEVSLDFVKETLYKGSCGNMKIIEDYANRKVEDSLKSIIINLDEKGFEMGEIARVAEVDLDFVKETLSE